MYNGLRIGVVIPARDEAPAIAQVLDGLTALKAADGSAVLDHICVCDNGSRDGTGQIAAQHGALVVSEARPGYGRACLSAIGGLPPVDVLLFVDGDCSVVPEQCLTLLEQIAQGFDLALGARSLGHAQAGALTTPQVFGNALAVSLIRLIWGVHFSDLGPCRAIRVPAYLALDMQDQTFGWTVEMQIKAVQRGLRCIEVPIDTRARLGQSKISGTVRGVIGAGTGILGMIWRLWQRERTARRARRASI
jgi:glycosyltransferase involved in cell wall biosynthesis